MSRREQPVRPGPLHQFATDLRGLRAATGLTYRALARKAGFSYSTLSAAAKGDALPTLDVTLAYVGACGGDTRAWEQRWHTLAAPAPEPITDVVTSQDNSPDNDPDAVSGAQTEPADTPEPGTDAPSAALTEQMRPARPGETVVIPTPRPTRRGRARARWLLAAALPVLALLVVLGVPRLRATPPQSLPTRPAGSATLPASAPRSSAGPGPSSIPRGGPSGVPGSASGLVLPPPVGAGSHEPGPNGAANSGAGVLGSGPGGGPAPGQQQPALAGTATAGPSCVTGNASPLQVNGSWHQLAGTATGGCADALTHKQTNDANTADWIFTPGAGRTCTFRAYVPNSSAITSTSATYKGWDTAPGRHDPADRLGEVRADQQANRGGWMLVGSFGPTKTGTIDLQLYDDGSEPTVEVADMVTAACT